MVTSKSRQTLKGESFVFKWPQQGVSTLAATKLTVWHLQESLYANILHNTTHGRSAATSHFKCKVTFKMQPHVQVPTSLDKQFQRLPSNLCGYLKSGVDDSKLPSQQQQSNSANP